MFNLIHYVKMEGIRTDLLIFLNELVNVHRDLNFYVSLCYDMYQNTLILKRWGESMPEKIITPEYKHKPTEIKLAYDQFFVEGEEKSIRFIFLHGLLFYPGKKEGSIVFGKNSFIINSHPDSIKDVRVVNFCQKNVVPILNKECFYH